jgi:hypothetical protein
MLELWQRFKFYGFLAVFVALPALGCLWVLLVRLGLPLTVPGLLWWLSIAVAPWWLLGASALLLVGAGGRYVLHRKNPQTERTELATGRRVPAPRPVRERGLVGLAALLLAGSALFPRHAPDGALLWESSELKRRAVLGTLRWEGEKMVEDFTDQRVWSCHYLTFHGIKTRVHTASRQFPYCPYFVYLYPRT